MIPPQILHKQHYILYLLGVTQRLPRPRLSLYTRKWQTLHNMIIMMSLELWHFEDFVAAFVVLHLQGQGIVEST